jgi:hypothetical protein
VQITYQLRPVNSFDFQSYYCKVLVAAHPVFCHQKGLYCTRSMAELTTGQAVKQSARTMSKSWSDRLKVASAKTSSTNTKDIDVAILKATTCRFHVVPKEKHVVTLKYVVSGSRTGGSYVAGALLKRLHTATDWLTALKTLVVVHRLIRETDAAAFMEELLRAGGADARGRGGRVLNVDNFLDTTNIEGRFDYSEWVRGYGKYIDETLETFSAIAWQADIEAAGTESKLRSLSPKDLLQHMPYLQRLQRRLVDCLPRGQAAHDEIVLLSLSMAVRESFKLYKALSEGIINLADCFFTMEYLDAVKGLEVYKEALASGETLATYYSTLQNVHAFKSAGDLPVLSQPPADFVEEMEMYIKDAPRPEIITSVAASGGGGGDGSASGGDLNASVAVPQPRRTVPLRKGRLAVQSSLKSTARTASGGDLGSSSRAADPGMVMVAGAAPESPLKTDVAEEAVEEGNVVEEEVVVEVAPEPIMDLLGFDIVVDGGSGGGGGGIEEGQAVDVPAPPAAAPSAMDLLGELDFGMMNLGGTTAHQYNHHQQQQQQQQVGGGETSVPTIPDAFVVQAAADVYGRPPPLHEAVNYAQSSSTAVGFYGMQTQAPSGMSPFNTNYTPTPTSLAGGSGQIPPPWMTQQPQQQYNQPQYNQQQMPVQYAYTKTHAYQQQQQQAGYVNFGNQQQWGSPPMGSTPPGGRDAGLIRQAGAHDPFSALPGLPSSPP